MLVKLPTVRQLIGMLLAVGMGVIILGLSYVPGYSQTLLIGGDVAQQRRQDDAPYLVGFHASEPTDAPCIPWWSQTPYRWATDAAQITLPGLGAGRWLVRVRAAGHPVEQATPSQWDDSQRSVTLALQPQPRIYQWLADAPTGDLQLSLRAPLYRASGDPRPLSLVLFGFQATTLDGWQLPAWRSLAWMALTLLACWLIWFQLGGSLRLGMGMSLLVVGLGVILISYYRAGLGVFTPTLALLGGLGWLLSIGLSWAGPRLLSGVLLPPQRWALQHWPQIVAVIVVAFGLRLGGMLHPQTIFSDIGLNANNLRGFTTGQVLFTERLPGRVGGGEAPYPPGQYLLLAPWQLLTGSDGPTREVLIQVGAALLDSLVVGVVWYLALSLGAGSWGALAAALLYVAPRPILLSFSIGEFANLYGQILAWPVLFLLSVAGWQLSQRRIWRLVLLLLPLSLVGHSGVTLSMGLWLASLGLIWLLSQRQWLWPLLGVSLLGVLLVGLIYYSGLTHVFLTESQPPVVGAASQAAPPAPCPNDPPAAPLVPRGPGDRLIGLVTSLDRSSTQTSPLLLLLACGGLLVAYRHAGDQPQARSVRSALAAWYLSALLAVLPLLVVNQTVRWAAFVAPALAIGAGVALAWVARHGRAGRLVAWIGLMWLVWQGWVFWVERLYDYLH